MEQRLLRHLYQHLLRLTSHMTLVKRLDFSNDVGLMLLSSQQTLLGFAGIFQECPNVLKS